MDVTATAPNNFIVSVIDTHTSDTGTGGNVSITTGNLNVIGDPSSAVFFVDSGTTGPAGGHGGDITFTARNIELNNTFVNSGDFIARAIGPEAAGSGGNITITADVLHLTAGRQRPFIIWLA